MNSNIMARSMEALEIPFQEIESATNNFADENLIAVRDPSEIFREMSFVEKIYRGQLIKPEQKIDIVVWMCEMNDDCAPMFMHYELKLCLLEHKNINSILHFCRKRHTIFLVNKIEANGSLAKHLPGSTLTWKKRLSICIGVAEALKYVHNPDVVEPGHYLIHGNIKSSKILLDENWQPKLQGFICAMLAERNTLCVTSKFKGTLQYKDPAYENTGGLTDKSDVFSFGVVLFEVLFGRKASTPNEQKDNWNFAEFARLHWKNKTLDKLIDPDLRKNMDTTSIKIFSDVAYVCLTEQREERPNMDQVVRALEISLELQKNHERSMVLVTETSSKHLQGKSFEHLMIPLKDILSATENFHSKYKIGSGGYGTVYKAKLEHFDGRNPSTAEGGDDGGDRRKICSTVAIKCISSTLDGTGEQGFIAEVKMLTNCKHPNIVSLLGFCDDGPQKILIYEYVPNGSLDGYLERSYRMTNLTWGRRIQICLDIAHGLDYLHSGLNGNEIIIHRDIKSANILLDDNFRAKIADFGLSRLNTINSKNSTINTVNLAGTELYLDPEYMKTGKLKKASDIYSFGVVLFEILCGRLAHDTEKGLPSIARRLFKEGKSKEIVDPNIKETDGSIFSHNRGADQHSLDTFLNIANQCLAETQDERPTLEKVIKELEKALNFQKNKNLQILLEDINLATQNFSDCNCIGKGKFWKLYKGDVPQAISNAKGCTAIVAKRWNMSGQGRHQQFLRELEFVFRHKHENVIDLVGYCTEMEEKIIVYEHSSKGSLDKYLKDVSLSWMERLKICIDVASGLEFLHGGGWEDSVMMHGDIKSGNILIDGNGKAKISNLELTTTDTFHQRMEYLRDADGNSTEFLDPSIVERGKVTKEFDIYSLGVLLFEALSGRLAKEEGCDWSLGPLAIRWCRDGELDEMVFEGIKDQIDPFSFDVFTSTAYSCFKTTWRGQTNASNVLGRLKDALEFQIDIEDIPKTSLKDIKLGSDDKCIQEGRYWKLYDAQVQQDNANGWTTVFAKRWDNKSFQAHALFLAELRNLFKYKNEHIVAFVGYCNELNEKIILYEHASNGSLDKHLDDASFTWKKRLNVCINVASGLQCLHESGRWRVHKVIKSGSILIDGDWKGKIANLEYYPHVWLNDLLSNYGCSSVACPVALDPMESDYVYALGVVLLEILCGRLAWPEGREDHSQSLGPLAQQHYKEKGNLDELVFKGMEEQIDPESLILFQGIALKCLENDRGRLEPSDVEIQLRKALKVEEFLEAIPQLSLEDIKQGTQNFSDDKCVGKGKYWKLYEGEFPDANVDGYTTALVKRWGNKSREARYEFLTERRVLSRYKYDDDIVGIEGCCNEMDEKIIVYEHGCNRSLDKHLDDASLSWTKRLNICLDVAWVVNSLHRDGIGLRDIKSGSILIDGDWKGKVYNLKLGLSRGGYYPLAENDRIHELGVVLLELLCGRLDRREGCKDRSQSLEYLAKTHYDKEGNLDKLVFEGIKEQIAPESLIAYQEIALDCISADRDYCWLFGREVVKPLRKALELQEDHERWNSKLPKEYKEYIQMSKTPEIYSTEVKKDLHDMLTKGILLQQDQLWFTLGANGERNEMISSIKFAYKNRPSRVWQSIPESRFQKVAQMLDISNLKIQIRIKTQFLSPGIDYRVYLVFKICGSRKSLAKRVYVNLSYKRGEDNLHAYFATWRDDEWMMIELCRFSNDKKDVDFEAFLKSFSRYYCGSRIIYVEGIEFRAIENVKYVQQVLKSSLCIDEVQQSPIEGHEIFKISGNDEDDKMFSVNKGNGKKHLVLSPIEFLCESSNVKSFDLNPSSVSRYQEVEFLPQQVFGIKCKIESQMLSPDTDYMCYLVFKFSEKCNGLHGPVIIRDLLNWKNKETGILYFRSPSPWNLHDTDWVPRGRKDGWMEVTVWKFNSMSKLRNDSVPMNLKLITYDGTMSGLIVSSLEIRPI